ncbi:MAG: hypothetical protein HRU18_16700 [Pseudoalteromonas sp.]|uniref:hypothetical protein n=1 Tax=Pseudoalteromonas sp. TaxID=53249 RepID=UPI001D7CB6EA|nr:hypothetical protein [Pseudoalteromonas sp.]NRA79846.1 hypothetical protein [Pseudoalteromonas sp.]
MGVWTFQSNLNRGELDPLLVGRIDIQAYYNGLRKATNVLTIPQGGAKRRPGQDYLGTALGSGRLENFSFSVFQSYMLIFTSGRMQVYKNGQLQTNLNGSGNDFIATPWTLTQILDFDFIQSADTAIITHEDVPPQSITRTSDTNWTIGSLALTSLPQFDFNDGSSPAPASEVQDITFADVTEGDRYKLALDGFLSDEVVFGGDDETNHEAIRDALQNLPNTGSSGIVVSTQTSLLSYRVAFTGKSAAPYKLATGAAIYTSIATFAVTTARVFQGSSSNENVWSALRGYPRTCTFHEARLYFGGSRSRPATIWGSNVNDFFNFAAGRSRDDELIDVTLNTDQVNAIQSIFSNRSLQVFTSGAEFYVKESPITPSNVTVTPQTNLGSRRVRPVSIDGVTLFPQRTGKVINQFVFVNEFQSNQTVSISTLAAHLIKKPIKLVASKGTESTDANYIYILNGDGSLTVFNTLASEDVTAFTTWSSGLIRSITVVSDRLYLLIERVINNVTVFYIEVESLTALTDSAVTTNVGGSDTITGLDHLNGETVDVKADGAFKGSFVVVNGSVTINRPATIIEVGLNYVPLIKTMPLNIGLENGPNAASKKKILRAAINFHESNGIIVNNQRLADKTIGLNQFNAPTPQTGLKRISLLGWSLEADIEITQTTPMPMTILSIGMEIKT